MYIGIIGNFLVKGTCGAVTSDIIDLLAILIIGSLSTLKVLVPRFYKHYMLVIVSSAIYDWSRVNDKKSRWIMMQYAYLGRIIFIFQMTGAYAGGCIYIFTRLPFINNLSSLNSSTIISINNVPVGPICWMSIDISIYRYAINYVLQSVQILIAATCAIGGDVYFFSLGMHICGAYEVLYNTLESLYQTDNPREIKLKLSVFVDRHKDLLMLANYFEYIYSFIALSVVAINIVFTAIFGK